MILPNIIFLVHCERTPGDPTQYLRPTCRSSKESFGEFEIFKFILWNDKYEHDRNYSPNAWKFLIVSNFFLSFAPLCVTSPGRRNQCKGIPIYGIKTDHPVFGYRVIGKKRDIHMLHNKVDEFSKKRRRKEKVVLFKNLAIIQKCLIILYL